MLLIVTGHATLFIFYTGAKNAFQLHSKLKAGELEVTNRLVSYFDLIPFIIIFVNCFESMKIMQFSVYSPSNF